jgi:hypothetical protein
MIQHDLGGIAPIQRLTGRSPMSFARARELAVPGDCVAVVACLQELRHVP